jgi:predicted AlkP superfamily pyrophosphatase or phosphodiesterase
VTLKHTTEFINLRSLQDGAEHGHGYMSNEAIKALKMIDGLLGQMLAKLER